MRKICALGAAMWLTVCGAAPAWGWGGAPVVPDVVFIAKSSSDCGVSAGGPVDRAAVPAPAGRGLAGKPVENAPYSGVGTTEVVRTLADGNRIVRTNTMRYFRDGKGRTRTEIALAAVGPFTLEEERSIITIEDPVAERRYVLHPEMKRAHVFELRPGVFGVAGFGAAPGVAQARVKMRSHPGTAGVTIVSDSIVAEGPVAGAAYAGARVEGPVIGNRIVMAAPGAPMPLPPDCAPQGAQSKRLPPAVSLGERTIEGVRAIGSRHEFNIAAGEIGNEQPITVRSEQWFSPDLGVVLESTHRDPLVGDTMYRLTRINRTEPDASLFVVPADYTVESIAPPRFEAASPPPSEEAR